MDLARPFLLLSNENCPFCIIAAKYLSTVSDNVKQIMIGDFFNTHIQNETERQQLITRLTAKPITVPYVLMYKENKWVVINIEPFIKKTFMRLAPTFKP